MRRGGIGACLALAAALTVASPVAAQNLGTPVSPIVTLDQDRLFSESQYGRRVTQELTLASEVLTAENRRIEAELIAEEQELTERRAEMPASEFRELAQAFDEKVTRLREEQDAKTRAFQRRRDLERQAFLNQVAPILAQLVRDTGAVAILDSRAVVLSSSQIDVTNLAIARVDAALGDGSTEETEEDTPEVVPPSPDPAEPDQ